MLDSEMSYKLKDLEVQLWLNSAELSLCVAGWSMESSVKE